MIQETLIHLICPFLGTIGYAVLYHVPARYYLSCGLTGMMGWIAYCLTVGHTSPAIASFFGSLVVVLMARGLTVRLKCPITIFLISAIFPLVPGAGIYNTVYHLVTNEVVLAVQYGMNAVKVAFGIVMGMAFVLPVPREVFHPSYWTKRNKRKA